MLKGVTTDISKGRDFKGKMTRESWSEKEQEGIVRLQMTIMDATLYYTCFVYHGENSQSAGAAKESCNGSMYRLHTNNMRT